MNSNSKEQMATREGSRPAGAEQQLKELGVQRPRWSGASMTSRSTSLSEPEAYRRDVPNAQVHVLDVGHCALDTAADEIAALVRGFVGPSRERATQ